MSIAITAIADADGEPIVKIEVDGQKAQYYPVGGLHLYRNAEGEFVITYSNEYVAKINHNTFPKFADFSAPVAVDEEALAIALASILYGGGMAIGATSITPQRIVATGAGSVAAGAYRVSVANVGAADGTVMGEAIKPQEDMVFGGDIRYLLGEIDYDGTGTTLHINIE